MRLPLLTGGWLFVAALAFAEPPNRPPSDPGGPAMPAPATVRTTDLDRIVLSSLKEVHNAGAELYNDGRHAEALRIYQGGLIVAKPLLDHRPKQQAEIREGLEQVTQSNADAKLKAFRLHEVIEQIRGELKEAAKQAALAEKPLEAAAAGTVTVAGKPAAGVAIAFIPVNTTKALATAKSDAQGAFHVPTTLTVGSFLVTLTGDTVPAKYGRHETTPLRADLKAGVNSLQFDAK